MAILQGEGILEIFNKIIEGADKAISGALNAVKEAGSPSEGALVSGGSHSEGILASIKSGISDVFGRDKSAPEIAPAKEQEVAIAAAPARQDPHHVDMAELGGFPPPSFGNAGMSQGIGRA